MPLINRVPALINSGGGGESTSKCGVSIDNLIGDSNSSGVYQPPSDTFSWDSSGEAWSIVPDYAFYYKFCRNPCAKTANFSNVKEAKIYSFRNAFENCTNLTSVDFSNLKTISGENSFRAAFNSCTNLTSVDFSNLETISRSYALSYVFQYCTNLTSVDFSNLKTISGGYDFYYAFENCTNLTSVDFSNLETISNTRNFYYAFNGTGVNKLTFPSLTTINNTGSSSGTSTFYGNTTITVIAFPKLSNITGNYIFSNCSSLAEIHFGAENQEAIEASSGYSTLWGRGAGNATVYFDL